MKSTGESTKPTKKQEHILRLLYKFRFITAPLIAEYDGLKSRTSSYMTLEKFASLGYIGKRQHKNTTFDNKGGTYYLLPKAMSHLKKTYKLNDQVLHTMYKNKSVGDTFIEHNLNVLRSYLALREHYGEEFHIFTKSELAGFDGFPENRPDLFLDRKQHGNNVPNEFMVNIFTREQFFVVKKRFNAIVWHHESGKWDEASETVYPVAVFVLPDANSEVKLREHALKVLDKKGLRDDLIVYTTSFKALLGSRGQQNQPIWSDVIEPGELFHEF